jgi:hypothetical protein|tara:strand:- start:857 stop:1030 length:174 start_codon:yes stop_codon:yes gene_type:complete
MTISRSNTKKQLTGKQKRKFNIVMNEFEKGTLQSSNGRSVKNKKQAIAIAYSEARGV